MKALIVDDDFTNRRLMQVYLRPFADCDVAVDGPEALRAAALAMEAGQRYDLICLDIRMPNMDGDRVLEKIRQLEAERGILVGCGSKVVMTTMLGNASRVMDAFRNQCDGYLVKPVQRAKLIKLLVSLALLDPSKLTTNAA